MESFKEHVGGGTGWRVLCLIFIPDYNKSKDSMYWSKSHLILNLSVLLCDGKILSLNFHLYYLNC